MDFSSAPDLMFPAAFGIASAMGIQYALRLVRMRPTVLRVGVDSEGVTVVRQRSVETIAWSRLSVTEGRTPDSPVEMFATRRPDGPASKVRLPRVVYEQLRADPFWSARSDTVAPGI